MGIVDYRFRAGDGNTLVLQVADETSDMLSGYRGSPPKWRDGTVEDSINVFKLMSSERAKNIERMRCMTLVEDARRGLVGMDVPISMDVMLEQVAEKIGRG